MLSYWCLTSLFVDVTYFVKKISGIFKNLIIFIHFKFYVIFFKIESAHEYANVNNKVESND